MKGRWDEERRSAQASLVSAWPMHLIAREEPLDQETGRRPILAVSGATVEVRNASQLPIYDVQVYVRGFVDVPGDADGRRFSLELGHVEHPGLDPERTETLTAPGDEVLLNDLGPGVKMSMIQLRRPPLS